MYEETSIATTLNLICRTCLTSKLPDELTSLEENCIVETICKVLHTQLPLDPSFPNHICNECVSRLNNALEFQEQVIRSEIYLKTVYLEENKPKEPLMIPALDQVLIFEDAVLDTTDNNNYEIIKLEADLEDPLIKAEDLSNISKQKPLKIVNFACDLCQKTFRFELMYRKHRLKHGLSLECELCLKLFEEFTRYMEHLKVSHSGYKPYSCPSCKERFFTLTPLKMHYSSHINGYRSMYKCKLCGKRYCQFKSLQSHKQKSHSIKSEKYHKCSVCSKTFAGPNSLRNHLKIHTGEKEHSCTVCGTSFIHAFSLKSHMLTHTGEKPFSCKLCDHRFTTSSYLKIHMRTHTNEKPYGCSVCAKSFVSKCSLLAHMKSHSGEKKFVCDICGWRSSRSSDLQTHIRKHTGERPYKCLQCDKRFKTASNLATHRRTHSGLKEYMCNICNKAFGDSRVLKSHIRVHTGESPYMCDVCGRRYKQSGQLSAHRKIHLNNKLA